MAAQDVLDDGEPQAGAALPPMAPALDPVESLGQPRQMLGRDPRPLVGDRDPHAGPAGGRTAVGGRCVDGACGSTRTVVPSPPYLIALSIRLTNS